MKLILRLLYEYFPEMHVDLVHPGWERRVPDVAVYDLIQCVLFLPVHSLAVLAISWCILLSFSARAYVFSINILKSILDTVYDSHSRNFPLQDVLPRDHY